MSYFWIILFGLMLGVVLALMEPSITRKFRHPFPEHRNGVVLRRVKGIGLAALMFTLNGPIQLAQSLQRKESLAMSFLLIGMSSKGPSFSGGSTPHYGTAQFPRTLPGHISSNAVTSGWQHAPTTPAQLNALLTGGTLSGHALAAGDTIVLLRGTCYNDATYLTHRFPVISGAATNPIRVITSNTTAIPAVGSRWIPATHDHATPHFRQQGFGEPAFTVVRAAHGYHFIGVQADSGSTTIGFGTLQLGPLAQGAWSGSTTYGVGAHVYGGWISLQVGNLNHTPAATEGVWWRKMDASDVPTNILLDRCCIASNSYSNKNNNIVVANTASMSILGSHLWNEGGLGLPECHALVGWDGIGPWRLYNSRIAAPGISFLTGGSDPSFLTQINDITVQRCHFGQPSRWIATAPDYDGFVRLHKNIFEYKATLYSLIEDCLFENGYDGGQSQYQSIVFKSSNQNGAFPQADTGHVTFRYNRLKKVNGLFNLGARDDYSSGGLPAALHDVSIYHNYTDELYGYWNPIARIADNIGRGIQLNPQSVRIHIEHITAFSNYTTTNCQMLLLTFADRSDSFTFRNTIFQWGGSYGGIFTDSFAYQGNAVFAGGTSSQAGNYIYDPTNEIPTRSLTSVYSAFTRVASAGIAGLVRDFAGGDWRTATALTGAGYGGRTPGCDISTVNRRTSGCVTGVWL